MIYMEPPGLRAANRPKRFFIDDSSSAQENSPITPHPGWPKTFAYGSEWIGSVRMIPSDLDGDGKGEIVISPPFWHQVLIFKENGDISNKIFIPQNSSSMFSIGDIDNNKKKEIVTTYSEYDYPWPLHVYVSNCFGNLIFDKNLSPNMQSYQPISADLNNDRQDETIIESGIPGPGGQTTLQIIDGLGNIVSKLVTRTENNLGSDFSMNPVIGNFDSDADLEIAVPLWHLEDDGNQKTYIEIYNLDGTPVPGWENVVIPELIYNPVCGDLNHDGRDEFIACTWYGPILIFASDGQLLLKQYFSNGWTCGSPAIGDINNDGNPEIVFHLFNHYLPTSLLAIDLHGKIVFEKEIYKPTFFSPLIGDVDGDGIPDIVFGNDDYIYAFNRQGKDISGFPIDVNGNDGSSYGPGPSICDIDHDGKIEITYTKYNFAAFEFSLYVLDVDSPYNPYTMEWPMHQHDPGHSGRYRSISDIAITSPNGGENWTESSSHAIIWRSPDTIAKVNIDYSTNKGSNWSSIVSGTINDRSYTWTVPNTPSLQCLVRVSDTAHATVSDTSNAVFTILMNLDLQVERREAKAFSILRYYGQIQFTNDNSSIPVAQYRIMRRQGSGDFVLLRTIAPSELQNNQFQMQDKYLEKDIPYTYRVEAYDAAAQLIGISLEKTI